MQRIIFIIFVCLILGGCGSLLRSTYTPPATTIPDQWAATDANGTSADVAQWPTGFGDPELSRLVKLALERNNNLAAATLRVRQAQLKAGLAQDDLLPNLSANVGSNHDKSLKGGDWSTTYSANFGVSYEADLWGKLSRTFDAAQWEAVATEEDRLSTALALTGTTMKLYWQIAYRNVRLDLSNRNIESAEKTLELMLAQVRFGAASLLKVSQAEQDLASLKADHQSLVQQRQEDINALAVLFDMPPGKIMADPGQLTDATLPAIPAGLPAELLGRRPDLRAAELRLRKLLANTDAARASFYPALSLTGSLGSSSRELVNILENPLLALASSVAFPFLNWNNLQLNQKVTQAEYDEAVINFRQTLYEAMAEVENALSNHRNLTEQGKHLEENVKAAREVERIYEIQYQSGYGTLKDWLDAQDTRRTAEKSMAENMYNRLTNFVTLYQALGGEPAKTEQDRANRPHG